MTDHHPIHNNKSDSLNLYCVPDILKPSFCSYPNFVANIGEVLYNICLLLSIFLFLEKENKGASLPWMDEGKKKLKKIIA